MFLMNLLRKENLFAFLFSGNPKKTDTDQITLGVFLLYLKRNNSQKLSPGVPFWHNMLR